MDDCTLWMVHLESGCISSWDQLEDRPRRLGVNIIVKAENGSDSSNENVFHSCLQRSKNVRLLLHELKIAIFHRKVFDPKIDTFLEFWRYMKCVNLWAMTVIITVE